jgi:PAS domain S-box-containing protein
VDILFSGGGSRMQQEYDCIPFGVIVLKGNPLTVECLNHRAKKMLNLSKEFVDSSIDKISFLKQYSSIIFDCFKNQKEKNLSEVELLQYRFFTVIISGKSSSVELYFLETTEDVLQSRKKLEYQQTNLIKEREKLVNISTELKAKCDIIEILRNREKEHLMHLKDVINNISEGIIVIDNKGKFSLCNRAAYTITGLNIGELNTTSALLEKYNIIDMENKNIGFAYLYESIFKNYFSIKNYIIKLIDRKTNADKYIEINSSPIFNLSKELVYTIVTFKDVTEAKIHQLIAEEQANFVNDVVNNLDVPIAVIDYPDLTYKLMNKKHKDMSKYFINSNVDIIECIGQTNHEVLGNHLSQDLFSIIKRVGENGKEYSVSPFAIIDRNGCERLYKFKISPYKDIQGKVNRIHLHGLDITDELNHSRNLEKVTRLKDEFFTVISHELRTPLTIIYSSLQLAFDIYKDEITPNVDKTLGRINQNCSRLLKLINNILDLSKAEAGFLTLNNSYFDVVCITEDIVSSVNLYAKSKQIELIFDTNLEEYLVYMDKDKYEKVLLNLLSNSIKFTPDKRKIMVIVHIEKEKFTLKVIDEGIGIPKDKLNYIFDRFAQVNTSLSRRAEGTGIGLSLVKKLVEYMNGQIAVVSEEGIGSEFVVTYEKTNIKSECKREVAIIDSNINYKVNIEFSDIN